MISAPDRRETLQLIEDAVAAGEHHRLASGLFDDATLELYRKVRASTAARRGWERIHNGVH